MSIRIWDIKVHEKGHSEVWKMRLYFLMKNESSEFVILSTLHHFNVIWSLLALFWCAVQEPYGGAVKWSQKVMGKSEFDNFIKSLVTVM